MRWVLPVVTHLAYSPAFPTGHRFPMAKFQLLADWVRAEIPEAQFFSPDAPDFDAIRRVHSADYVAAFQSGTLSPQALREIGLPWSEGLAVRTPLAVAGSLLTAELASTYGVACHLAGGTHHAHVDRGSGFCIYNDLAIIARKRVAEGTSSRVLIFDCDVHQGDGTASILAQDAAIFTCSLHGERNFPVRRARSDMDVELPDGLGDADYLAIVQSTWESVVAAFRPDFVIYDAGADVHTEDVLGRLAITDQGMYARDRFVLSACLAQQIPVATVIGGGYAPDQNQLAARHGIVVRAARDALVAEKSLDNHLHFENRLA